VGALPGEGFRDIGRRLGIGWLWVKRLRVRRALSTAEGELGWLGWEQVDFYDEQIVAEVQKVREYENTQASLMNTSAELSGRKAALDEELAREKAKHDEAQKELAEERGKIAGQLEQAENKRRQKLAAVQRFGQALEELAGQERELQKRSLDLMNVVRVDLATRVEAREVSDALARVPAERRLVLADKATAADEAARLEPGIAQFRAELQRIDGEAAAAGEGLAEATRRVTGELLLLERERDKSNVHMSRLDKEKLKPYRAIGACLADHGIAPLNQPEILEKVFALREREAGIAERLGELRAACASMDRGVLVGFYVLLAAILFVVAVIGFECLRH
jgi:chromosome segregation ATPase